MTNHHSTKIHDLITDIRELFPQLAEDEQLLQEFDDHIKVKSYKKGDIIVDYGDQIKFVPLVLEGILKVLRENEDEKEVLLYFLSGGHTCAASFSCCMIKKRSEIKVIADTKCRVAFIPLDTTNEWMRKYSTWRNFVFSAYDERLFSMIDTIDRLAFSKLDEQLLNYLHERADLMGNKEIRLSHADIARDLSVSREAISRLLKKLEDQGTITLGRNKIILKQT
ncbi:MAG: Crp/Fnr family transcriptional regulator [Bacteroidetes bacterium]|nr:Crp/Fnr family transcriptional regulator [Bacteroidota bacterium]